MNPLLPGRVCIPVRSWENKKYNTRHREHFNMHQNRKTTWYCISEDNRKAKEIWSYNLLSLAEEEEWEEKKKRQEKKDILIHCNSVSIIIFTYIIA